MLLPHPCLSVSIRGKKNLRQNERFGRSAVQRGAGITISSLISGVSAGAAPIVQHAYLKAAATNAFRINRVSRRIPIAVPVLLPNSVTVSRMVFADSEDAEA